MTKAITSAEDFASLAAGKTDVFEVEGMTVELRGLDWAEMQSLRTKYEQDEIEMAFQMAYLGLQSPKIEEGVLRKARPSIVQALVKRVAEISGTARTEADGPLAGDGLSPA